MTIVLIILTVIVAFDVILRLLDHRRPSDNLVKMTMLVNLRNGNAVRGVLLQDHSDRLTFAEAGFINGSDGRETPIDGFTHVPKSEVVFMQQIPPKTD